MEKGRRFDSALILAFAIPLLLAAENRVWTEPTSGKPGEYVTVVVKGSWDESLNALAIAFRFDPAETTYLGCYFDSGLGIQSGLVDVIDELEEDALLIGARADPQRGNIFPAAQEQEVCRLVFRIRSHAPAGVSHASIVEKVEGRPWDTSFSTAKSHSLRPLIENGGLTIEPPSGPLPPDLLFCVQQLSSVRLSWENPVEYDSLLVRRDGENVGSLSGDATEFVDRRVSEGNHEYEVEGRKGESASVGVRCRITVTEPRAEPVEDLTCLEDEGGVELHWVSPRSYSRIEIRKNGEMLDTVEGDVTSYTDSSKPEGATLYEVVGYVEDIAGSPVPCVAGAEWTGRLASVTVPPGGGVVEIPVYFTNPGPLGAIQLGLTFNPSQVAIETQTLEGTLLEGRDLLRFDVPGEGWGVFAYEFCKPWCWSMPPAVEACYMKLVCEVSPSVPEGTIIPLEFEDGLGDPPHDCIMVPEGGRTSVPFRKINGEIIVGRPQVKGLTKLAVKQAKSSRSLYLRWRNGDTYDEIEIERNGVLLGRTGGGAESFVDHVPSTGIYWYRVRGIRKGTPSPWKVAVYAFLPGASLFRRGEVTGDGAVNLADALAVCFHLFTDRPLDCLDAADTNDDGKVNLADAVYLLSYLFVGGEAPPPPGVETLWMDPTPDELGCNRH